MDRGDGPHNGANHNAPDLVMPDLGDGPHVGPNHAEPVHNPQQEILQAIEQDEQLDAGMIHLLRFVLINGLVMEAIDLLRQIRDELEANNIVNNFDNIDDDNEERAEEEYVDGRQVEDAPAEPRVDLEVNHPVEAEDPLPGGSGRNEPPGAISDSDLDSDAEEEAPSTSSVPGGSRRRSREEDEGDKMSRKRFRCWNELTDSDSDTDSDTDDEEPAHSSSRLSGGTSKRRREEEDDDDSRGSKQSKRRRY